MEKQLIEISRLQYCFVTVSEKILDKNLKKFMINSLKQNKLQVTKNSKVFYTYLEPASIYQISIFESDVIDSIPIIDVVKMNASKNVLVVSERFFVVYEKGVMLLYQKINDQMSIEDYKQYIFSKFKISIDEVGFIPEKDIYQINPDLYQSSLTYIEFENFDFLKKYFTYVGIVAIFSCTIYLSPFYKEESTLNKDKLNVLQQEYNNLVLKQKIYDSLSMQLLFMISQLKQHEIALHSVQMNENRMCNVKLICNSKDQIYKFMDKYNKKIEICLITFHDVKAQYVVEANIYL